MYYIYLRVYIELNYEISQDVNFKLDVNYGNDGIFTNYQLNIKKECNRYRPSSCNASEIHNFWSVKINKTSMY